MTRIETVTWISATFRRHPPRLRIVKTKGTMGDRSPPRIRASSKPFWLHIAFIRCVIHIWFLSVVSTRLRTSCDFLIIVIFSSQNRHDGRRYHLPDYVVGIYYAIKLRKNDIGWEETGEAVAIKAVSWECIRAHQNSRSENFVQEVKALNHLSDELRGRSIEETHVLTDITVMFNISHLYLVMPYCAGPERDLCMRVAASLMDQGPLTEDESRFYFKQMLKVSFVVAIVFRS